MMQTDAEGAPLSPRERLQAQSLYLQPPLREDMAFIRWLWSDTETMQPVGGPVVLTDDQAERWYARMVDPGRPTDCYCLIRLQDHSPVGEISFHRLDVQSMAADFNIKVMASARGKGIAREAIRRFLDYYFGAFGGRVLVDDVAAENPAGQAALQALGFRRVSAQLDSVRFELTRDEFNQHSRGKNSSSEQEGGRSLHL